jgi:hypothetical protein
MKVNGKLHAPPLYWIGGWVSCRAGLGRCGEQKNVTLPGIEKPGHPARSPSQYRLRAILTLYFRRLVHIFHFKIEVSIKGIT